MSVRYRRGELQVGEAAVAPAPMLLPYRVGEGALVQVALLPVDARVERALLAQVGIVQSVHALRQLLVQLLLLALLPPVLLLALRLERGVVLHQVRLVREVDGLVAGHGAEGPVAGHVDGFLHGVLVLLLALLGERGRDDDGGHRY